MRVMIDHDIRNDGFSKPIDVINLVHDMVRSWAKLLVMMLHRQPAPRTFHESELCPGVSELHHPATDLLLTKPLVVARRPLGKESSRPTSNRKIVFLNQLDLGEDKGRELATLLEQSAPLVPVWSKYNGPAPEPGADEHVMATEDVIRVDIEFRGLTTLTSTSIDLVEPMIVNIFLWDPKSKTRIAERWSFLAQGLRSISEGRTMITSVR